MAFTRSPVQSRPAPPNKGGLEASSSFPPLNRDFGATEVSRRPPFGRWGASSTAGTWRLTAQQRDAIRRMSKLNSPHRTNTASVLRHSMLALFMPPLFNHFKLPRLPTL